VLPPICHIGQIGAKKHQNFLQAHKMLDLSAFSPIKDKM
jgi:hypothetical protein